MLRLENLFLLSVNRRLKVRYARFVVARRSKSLDFDSKQLQIGVRYPIPCADRATPFTYPLYFKFMKVPYQHNLTSTIIEVLADSRLQHDSDERA